MLMAIIELQHRLAMQMDQITAVQRYAAAALQDINDDILEYLAQDFSDDRWEGGYPSLSIH